ncbi:hypothetical protein [Streptosporangium sp. NPDC002607]
MPDTLIGAKIRPNDFPRAVTASDSTAINDISSTSFIVGSPVVSATFVAPTSGAVLLSVGLSARDNGGINRVHLAPEVRVGSSGGSVVLSADVTTRGVGTPGEITSFIYRSRTTLLTGLTGGTTYYVQTMHKVSGGSTADLQQRDLTVCPTPLGGNYAGQTVKALDFPPPKWSQDITAIANPANTSYIAGSPAVELTFVAPTSGRVLIIVGGGMGNSAGADRISLSPEVRVGTSSGAVVLVPGVTSRGWGSDNCSSGHTYGSRESVLEGLTPGVVYYAVVKYVVQVPDAGTTTADIACRDITVVPIP